jgi:hypothetical protein
MNTSELSQYVIKCQEMAGKIEERARIIILERNEFKWKFEQMAQLKSELHAEAIQWQALADSLNTSFGCNHSTPEDCMNLVRHVDELIEHKKRLESALLYVLGYRVNNMAVTLFDLLMEREPERAKQLSELIGK